MKIWQCLLLVSIFIAIPVLSACGPSRAELEYQERVKAYEEAQQRIKAEQEEKERKTLEEIRNWCIGVAVIIKSDSNIIDSWEIFQENSASISPFSPWDVKEQQERKFMEYMELYETLNTQLSSLDCPYECYEANSLLSNYLKKRKAAIMDLIVYYASGQDYYRLTYNEKLVGIQGLREQYLNKFWEIVNERNLLEDVSSYPMAETELTSEKRENDERINQRKLEFQLLQQTLEEKQNQFNTEREQWEVHNQQFNEIDRQLLELWDRAVAEMEYEELLDYFEECDRVEQLWEVAINQLGDTVDNLAVTIVELAELYLEAAEAAKAIAMEIEEKAPIYGDDLVIATKEAKTYYELEREYRDNAALYKLMRSNWSEYFKSELPAESSLEPPSETPDKSFVETPPEPKDDSTDVLAANFIGNPTCGLAPLVVQFNDLSTGKPTDLIWYFGDGQTSFSQNPKHIYLNSGTYTVRLRAIKNEESDFIELVDYITVEQRPLTADFQVSQDSGNAPFRVQFTISSTEGIDWLNWDFGDGTSSFARNPFHTYEKPGHYDVALTVKGPAGSYTAIKENAVYVYAQEYTIEYSVRLMGSEASDVGEIDINPPGLLYEAGTRVTLIAKPKEGYQFHSWSGSISSTSSQITLELNQNYSLVATFTEKVP